MLHGFYIDEYSTNSELIGINLLGKAIQTSNSNLQELSGLILKLYRQKNYKPLKMNKETLDKLLNHDTMIGHIFVLICSIGASVLMTVNYSSFIESLGKVLGIIFLIGVVGGLVVLIISLIKEIITLLKDLKSLKNNDFISIIGKVLKFKKNIEPESGVQINNIPIVLILDTGEEIELFINDKIMIGETYKFNYLKNCKIAEVIEKI